MRRNAPYLRQQWMFLLSFVVVLTVTRVARASLIVIATTVVTLARTLSYALTRSLTYVIARTLSLMLAFSVIPTWSYAETVQVAVTAEFAQAAELLAKRFQQLTSHRIEISVAANDKLFQQIQLGVPYDYFIAADRARPEQLEALGKTTSDGRITYALGQLALVQNHPFNDDAEQVTYQPNDTKKIREFRQQGVTLKQLAIANPAYLPYGKAAQAFIDTAKVSAEKMMYGDSISQTWHWLITRRTKSALVSLAQFQQYQAIASRNGMQKRTFRPLYARVIPTNLYPVIEHQAVLLSESVGATLWHKFLQSDQAQVLIKSFGYRSASDRPSPSKGSPSGAMEGTTTTADNGSR